nr:helix-turn-helix transcriptional regulator [Phascolarctobacterium succinatutens]
MFASRYKKIGAKIVFYRKLRSMTQEKLAEEVGITPQYLSRIENGGYTKSVSLSTLMMIAGALDVTMSQLMEGIEDTSL